MRTRTLRPCEVTSSRDFHFAFPAFRVYSYFPDFDQLFGQRIADSLASTMKGGRFSLPGPEPTSNFGGQAGTDETFPSPPAFQRAEQTFFSHSEIKFFFPSVSVVCRLRRLRAPFPQCYFRIGKQPCASPAATRFSSWPGCVALRWYRTPGAIKPYGGH